MARRKPKPERSTESAPEVAPAPLAAPSPPPLPAALDEPPARQKAALRLLQRAVSEGWEIPESVWKAAPGICTRILADASVHPRDRLRATEVLAAMARDKINAAIALDKIERLESGTATDRIVVTPELQARAERIIAKRLGTDAGT
jgi:hypothetical protein